MKRGTNRTLSGKVLLAAVLFILVVTTLASSSGPGASAAPSKARKVVIVVIDRIGLDDLVPETTPNILGLVERGGIALMNARVKYDVYGPGGYVVIGAGGRAIGGPNAGLAFDSGELLRTVDSGLVRAGELFDSRTGRRAARGGVVNLYIEEMVKASEGPQATSTPGLLGEALSESGKTAQLLGNADSLAPQGTVADFEKSQPPAPRVPLGAAGSLEMVGQVHRESACLIMDQGGVIASGEVSSVLAVRSPGPAGIETDFEALLAEAKARLPVTDVLVVDMGQTARVDEQAGFMTEERLAEARADALERSDRALGDLLDMLDDSDLVVVCSPNPSREMIEESNLLTPLVMAGPGISRGTRLHSTTTRRTGVVSSFDVAPSILQALGVQIPAEMDGNQLSAAGSTDLEGLRTTQDRAVGSSNTRRPMVKFYIIITMVLVGLLFLLLLFREDLVAAHRAASAIVLLAVLAGPLVYLVVPSFATPALAWLLPAVVVGCAVAGATAYSLRDAREQEDNSLAVALLRPMLLVSGVTWFALMLDTALGSRLMTASPFGSDIILGDRYYGIGNLYMGFAIGAAVLFASLALYLYREKLDRPWKRYGLAGVVLGITAIIIGGPRIGSQVGGLLAVVAGGSVMLMKLDSGRMTLRKVSLVVAIVLVCVAGLLLLDVLLPGSQSHASRAVSGAGGGGASTILTQVSRKLAANWSLLISSTWRLLLLLLVVVTLILNWRMGLFKRVKVELPELIPGLIGMAVALVVALLFNDSGIEAASALAIFLFVPYIMLLIPWHGVATGDVAEVEAE
ncbi:MAG: hypothetical protein KKF41_16485 [Actinobacteria bacterium]|nr:hypothetical protein [Actinomycetota bacterium]MBU1944626.1 hypothetical protein [Actinomycetota bacterium]MBU2689178.1 hypothetical protein [Actinomycetota bacterium]